MRALRQAHAQMAEFPPLHPQRGAKPSAPMGYNTPINPSCSGLSRDPTERRASSTPSPAVQIEKTRGGIHHPSPRWCIHQLLVHQLPDEMTSVFGPMSRLDMSIRYCVIKRSPGVESREEDMASHLPPEEIDSMRVEPVVHPLHTGRHTARRIFGRSSRKSYRGMRRLTVLVP